MDKNRVVLFYPSPSKNAVNLIPLNLMAIARMLDPEFYKVEIVNATVEKNYISRILNKAEKGNLLCLGVTCMTGYQIHDALKVAKKVKRCFPHIPIVWGGYHPTILSIETIRESVVDIVVKGQGELTFRELIERLSNNLPFEDVSGIVYKTKDGRVRENVDRPMVDLNRFPPLPWNLIDGDRYKRFDPRWKVTMDYYTSQGCPFSCKFCAEPMFCKHRWVSLNAERVVKEIKMLKKEFNVDAITIRDSNFFVDKRRVKKICEGLIREKVGVRLIGVNGRIDTLLSYEHKMWDLLYSAGFRELLIGAESGDQTVLDMLDKKITVRDIFLFSEKATHYNFKIWVSLMVGLPGRDNKEEFRSTFNLIDHLMRKSYQAISEVHVFKYTPYPGSALYDIAKEYGFIPPRSIEGWSSMGLFHERTFGTDKNYSRYVSYLTFYVLPRLIDPYKHKNSMVRLMFKKLIDPIFRWRWQNRCFDFFVERYLIDMLNYIGALKYKLMRKK